MSDVNIALSIVGGGLALALLLIFGLPMLRRRRDTASDSGDGVWRGDHDAGGGDGGGGD